MISYRPDNFTALPKDGQMPCAGILMSDNTFNMNFGCAKYGGSLYSLYCVPNGYDPDSYEPMYASFYD